jgi:succinoglycan biosynthesis transport protein ExoP
MELIKLYTALLRRRWLVVQSVVFFVVAAGILALSLPKNYVSAARVLVSSNDASMSILSDLGLSEVATGLSSSTDDIQNKISLSTTRPVLEEVMWRLQLRNSDGALYTYEEFLVPGMFGELLARPNIAVTQQQGTDLLLFEARTSDPELSRLVADTVVAVAIQQSQERSRAETKSARVFIQEQLEVVNGEFDQALSLIADAQAAEEVIDLETEIRAAIARISELMLSYENNAAAIQEVRARIGSQEAYQGRENVDRISPLSTAQNMRVNLLTERLEGLRQDKASELTSKTERHPDVIRLNSLIVSTQEQLDVALQEQHAMDPSIQGFEAELAALRKKGIEIDASIQRTTAEFAAYPEKMRRISVLKLAATAAEKVFESLQEQRYQIGVAEAMLMSDMKFIEPAHAPDRHSSPKLLVNLVLGLVLGVGFGLGLVFLFEYVDDTVKTPADLFSVWEVPRLGVIPRQKGTRHIIDDLPATDPATEAYRTIRNGLIYASVDKPVKMLAVSSAVPGEGKSTCTINLGISFARENKRVLLVDCDLRRPALHRAFSTTSNHRGLTDVLTGQLEMEDAIQDTPISGLQVLASGSPPEDPGRLIESLRLRQLLLDMHKAYDVVIVDTPPVLLVNDALVVARVVDGCCLVVESGRTSRKLVADMKGRFDAAGIEPLGLVLNKMDFYTSGYGAYVKAYRAYAKGRVPREAPQEASEPPAEQGGAA